MPLPGKPETLGGVGVAIFFVLSGFLMSYLYGKTPWDSGAVFRYCVARFARIAPIYWLVVSLCILLSYQDPSEDFPMKIVGSYQIARHYFFAGSGSVFWSIPPEIQYYGFFLLIWWCIALRTRYTYALPALTLLCTALVLTHALWPGLLLPNKLHLFLAGSMAGLIPRKGWETSERGPVLMVLQCSSLALVLAPVWLFASQASLYSAPEVGVAFAVGIYFLSIPSRWTVAVFASGPMRAIGRASFSIYLMHVLVFYYGMRWLHISQDRYDPLWWPLGCAAIAIPLVVSIAVEMPLQRAARRVLQRLCRLKKMSYRQAA
jgi:peptidoglycan/LPS O-acetylase OafA/YrhL